MATPLWAALRQPASFRGLPFVIEDNSLRRGRQIAMHTYAFRDDPWPEDMGRSPRITSFRGFVLGEDCDSQIIALIQAVEQAGPGTLVHPTLGSISATVLEFAPSNTKDNGRQWSFDMTVVPYVPRIYPVITANTQAQTQGLFGSVGTAIASDFAAVESAVQSGIQNVTSVVSTVQGYVGQAQSLVGDATALAHLPAALTGSLNLGRFASGGLAVNVAGLGGGIATIAQGAGIVTGAAATVSRLGGSLNSLASSL